MTLSAVEIEIERTEAYHFILKTAISSIKEHFDICFIDCPPSLGFLTVNALSAAHSILIPLQCEFYALEGLAHLLQTHHMITQNINHDLKIEGIVLTMYDKRNKLTEQVEDDVRSFLSTAVYNTVIPRNVKLSEAPSHGKPVLIYDVNCSGSIAYIELAKEMLAKNVLAA
jgi:chromosome partitioning protein